MPTIYIDDQAYEVPEGDNVLQAVLSKGLDLPYFCWHPEMGSVGACRQCALVQFRDEEDTHGRIVMGCMTPVVDGARFSMQGDNASEFRENIVESLMLNHPHDCPVCAEGGECHLQDMTVMVGHRNRGYRGKKNTHNNQDLGPLINHEMNRCIACYRCTRFYNDYAGGKDLSAQASRDHVYFGRQEDGTLESEFAGNLVEVCPTGVFTDKPLVNEYTRKWDLQSAPSVCTGCALGCNTIPGERYGKLKRIHNRFNHDVNGYFLCDRGRYGGAFVNDENRPNYAGLREEDGRYKAIEQQQAVSTVTDWIQAGTIAGIGSPRASIESNFMLQQLVGNDNFVSGLSDAEADCVQAVLNAMQTSGIRSPSMREVEAADAILVLGEDVTNTAPRLALSLRQSVRNLAKQLAADARIPEWQDEAVRNLAQDRLSPLFNVVMSSTPLDDVAESVTTMAPDDIARFGYAIASKLDASRPTVEGLDAQSQRLCTRIADALKSAKRPLIVSGTGAQNTAVVNAAATIARALNKPDAMLSYCLNEANTLGLSMLSNNEQSTLSDLCSRAVAGEVDTLLVVENDLYRRAPESQVKKLFENVKQLVILDVVATNTMSTSSLVLPAASFVEAEGTLVNSEGRAQRHYPVFLPKEQRQASWQWLNQLAGSLKKVSYENFDEITAACASAIPALANISEASPSDKFRSRGVKIPRQTHRYSGRTAMRADISVHEPKQPLDTDSPLAFTMEGDNAQTPGALLPFVWSPGWNSNQSLHKFQSEVGGALAGGTAGTRLIESKTESLTSVDQKVPDGFTASEDQWRLIPLYRIFGSDELSARSPAVAELVSTPFLQLSNASAQTLGVDDSDTLVLELPDGECTMTVEFNDSIPAGCIAYSIGLPGSTWLPPNTSVSARKGTKEDG